MEKFLGTLLIVNSVIVAAWLAHDGRATKTSVMVVALVGVFGGAILLMASRITELSVKGVGSIKVAADKAASDAEAIAQLRTRIEAQSATVDLVAASANEAKRLAEETAAKNAEAARSLAETDDALARATAGIAELEAVTEFTQIVVAAQNDDRRAFDRLHSLAQDARSPFRARALQAWTTVFEEHSKPFFVSGFTIPWLPNIDPSHLPLAVLARDYWAAPAQLRPALLEFIASRNDFSKQDRLNFLLEVLERDESLRAVEYAGRFFGQLSGAGLKPMAVDAFKDWWSKNRSTLR